MFVSKLGLFVDRRGDDSPRLSGNLSAVDGNDGLGLNDGIIACDEVGNDELDICGRFGNAALGDGVSKGAGCTELFRPLVLFRPLGNEFIGVESSMPLFPNGDVFVLGGLDENPLDAELLNISKPPAEFPMPLDAMGAGPETSGMF